MKANSSEALELSESKYIAAIWPVIQEANSRAEGFSQISGDLIAILPHDATFPRTDKGSMIRAKIYELYHDLIESLYTKEAPLAQGLELDVDETQCVLLQLAREELGIPVSTVDTNLFSEGVDSLKAIHFRRLILHTFLFSYRTPGSNIIFEAGNISRLAKLICKIQSGYEMAKVDDGEADVLSLVEKYSFFQTRIPETPSFLGSNSVVSDILLARFFFLGFAINVGEDIDRSHWLYWISCAIRDSQR